MHRHTPSSKWTTCFLFCILVSIPVICIYLGYSLSFYMSPARPSSDLQVIHAAGFVRVNVNDIQAIVDLFHVNYSYYKKSYLTLTPDEDKLGRAMFQYASLYGLSKANGFQPLIYWKNPLLNIFPKLKVFKSEMPDTGKNWPAFREYRTIGYDQRSQNLNFERNIRLDGLFQSWKYFDTVRQDVFNQFTFSSSLRAKAYTFLQTAAMEASAGMREAPLIFIGVHVRREGMLSNQNRRLGYRHADEHYLARAVAYMENRYKRTIFIIASDDKEWAEAHIKPKHGSHVAVTPYDEAAQEMAVLEQCNHTIMTTGAFGWWAAALAGGTTLYYQFPIKPDSDMARNYRQEDFFYPDWEPKSSF